MSMSTHVVGFRPADAKWNQMKTAYEACEAAGIPVPREVERFFDDEPPGDRPGAEVSIKGALCEWSDTYRSGYEVDLTKLPPDVRILRFYNAY